MTHDERGNEGNLLERQPGTLGIAVHMYQLKLRDVFTFVDTQTIDEQKKVIDLPTGRQTVTIAPWGPRSRAVGPVSPWMFACRGENGIERHFALSPKIDVRLLIPGIN